jgi:dynactin complex subunit
MQAVEARRSERLWRERMDAFATSLAQQKEDTLDITSDMLRQYKAMQEQLLKRVAELEADNAAHKQQLVERDAEVARLQEELARMRKGCDLELVEYQKRMEDMQLDFTSMLRSTLDQMHARLATRCGGGA